ncbi:hypothetical protein O5O45_12760 [Hahella aquimaris]|uniref:hypothetical protein n=1 Tax=Hahella sp. HNIBRBA332 TaxID=3015983 RepID=UPI00273B8BDE|nr:hypothetical protein [Hahella sp. HNIBRBA332]WLQ16790.1 hypothetical protein O5O45_12760 [Hahella sp. HNIBRBA332]
MTLRTLSAGLVAASFLLGGCAHQPNTDNNPRKGGFFEGLYGVYGGDYEARKVGKERELGEVNAETAEVEAGNRELEMTKAERTAALRIQRAELNKLRKQLDKASNNLSALKQKVGAQESSKQELQDKVAELEYAMNNLKVKLGRAEVGSEVMSAADMASLENQRDSLLDEYQLLQERADLQLQ